MSLPNAKVIKPLLSTIRAWRALASIDPTKMTTGKKEAYLELERELLWRKLCEGVTELGTFNHPYRIKYQDEFLNEPKLFCVECCYLSAANDINDYMRKAYDGNFMFTRFVDEENGVDISFKWHQDTFRMIMMDYDMDDAIQTFLKAMEIFDINHKLIGHDQTETTKLFHKELKKIVCIPSLEMSNENLEKMLSLFDQEVAETT